MSSKTEAELNIQKLKNILASLEEWDDKGLFILYRSSLNASEEEELINNGDIEIFRDILLNIKDKERLYLIITSIGGRINAAESIIFFLHKRFKEVYCIVPFLAKSAAALICITSNGIYMGDYSFLGPVGPLVGEERKNAVQIINEYKELVDFRFLSELFSPKVDVEENCINEGLNVGNQMEARREDVRRKEDIKNEIAAFSSLLGNLVYNPIFKLAFPLFEAKEAVEWVKRIIKESLQKGSNSISEEKNKEIKKIIKDLLEEPEIKLHERNLSKDILKNLGLNIKDLEEEPELEKKIIEIQRIARLLETESNVTKIIASSNGHLYSFCRDDALPLRNFTGSFQDIDNISDVQKTAVTSGWEIYSPLRIQHRGKIKISYYPPETSSSDNYNRIPDLLKIQLDKMYEVWDNEDDEFWNNV